MNPDAILQAMRKGLPESVMDLRAKIDKTQDSFPESQDDTSTNISAEKLLLQAERKKRVRSTAAAMRANIGDERITRDVPKEERKFGQELLSIDLQSLGQANKDRWRQASYCWNEKVFLYESYYYLTEKRDPQTNEFIWNNDLLWKFARDHKVELFVARQATPGLLNSKGDLRKRVWHGP